MADKCYLVEGLVGGLLWTCHRPSSCSFTPQLHRVIGVVCTYKRWSDHGENVLYLLLVPLRPFQGTPSTRSWMMQRKCQQGCLACMWNWSAPVQGSSCWGFCFLYHAQNELRGKQEAAFSTSSVRAPAFMCRKPHAGSRSR